MIVLAIVGGAAALYGAARLISAAYFTSKREHTERMLREIFRR